MSTVDMINYIVKLSSLIPCHAALHAVGSIWTHCSTHTYPLRQVAAGAGAPAPPVRAANNFAVCNMLTMNQLNYDTTAASFILGDGNNPEEPEISIVRLDPAAWNGVATGMYSAGPADTGKKLPFYIGTAAYSLHKYMDFLFHGMTTQLYWAQFGLASVDMVAVMTAQTLESYRTEITAVWSENQLVDQRLVPSGASATFEAIMLGAFGKKTYNVNNGICSLSYFDRLVFYGEPWAYNYNANALSLATMPVMFPDIIIEFFSRNMIDYAFPTLYQNAPGCFGFDLPKTYEATAGLYLPLMSEEVAQFCDKPWKRTTWDGKTFWNNKLRRWCEYGAIVGGVTVGYAPIQQANVPLTPILHQWNIVPGFFDAILTASWTCIARTTPNGDYILNYNNNAAASIALRQFDLKLVGANLQTWRFTGDHLPAMDYRYKPQAYVSSLKGRKTVTLKDQPPSDKVPSEGATGQPQ